MQITPLQRERYTHLWESYLRKVERLRDSRNNAITLIGKVRAENPEQGCKAGGGSSALYYPFRGWPCGCLTSQVQVVCWARTVLPVFCSNASRGRWLQPVAGTVHLGRAYHIDMS